MTIILIYLSLKIMNQLLLMYLSIFQKKKFLKLAENKGLLNIIFTQNVDSLELKAGVSRDKIVFAHGNRSEANCVICKSKVPVENIKESIKKSQVYYCEECSGPCKFSVVFFGESMPQEFFTRRTVTDI